MTFGNVLSFCLIDFSRMTEVSLTPTDFLTRYSLSGVNRNENRQPFSQHVSIQ